MKKENLEDVVKVAKIIGPLIDGTANEIFTSYNTKLLSEPITYIVPAVWGARKDGELTATQKEINKQVAPVIKKVFESLQLRDLGGAQEFALWFLIRGLIIAKITYLIEAFKKLVNDKTDSEKQHPNILYDLVPLGNA